MKRLVAAAVVAVALVVGVFASSATAVNGFPDFPSWSPPGAEMPGGYTSWSPTNSRYFVQGEGAAQFEFSEAYWPEGSNAPGFRVRARNLRASHDVGSVFFDLFLICGSESGEMTLTLPFRESGLALYSASADIGEWSLVGSEVTVLGANKPLATYTCPSGYAPSGLLVNLLQRSSTNRSSLLIQHYQMVWRPENFNPPAVDPDFCDSLFGPGWDLSSTALVGGETVTPSQVGCASVWDPDGDDGYWDDPWTDFEVACADPPTFDEEWSWTEFNTEFFTEMVPFAGNWIGHYASCLFIPQGPMKTEHLTDAFAAGWMGDVRDAVDALTDSVQSWDGGCGNLVLDLPGPFGSVSTCSAGAIWPEQFRSAAGWLVRGTAVLSAFFVLLRLVGWKKGSDE